MQSALITCYFGSKRGGIAIAVISVEIAYCNATACTSSVNFSALETNYAFFQRAFFSIAYVIRINAIMQFAC